MEYLITALIVALVSLAVAYFVIKAAVRNGINDSLLFATKEKWEKIAADLPKGSLPTWDEWHNAK